MVLVSTTPSPQQSPNMCTISWSPLYDINHFYLYSILMQYLIFVFSSPCLLMSALSILEGKPLEDIDYSCQHSSEEHLALNYVLQISTY